MGIPRHVAIIMDGNGRWARQRGAPRIIGHRAGIKRIKEMTKVAPELGIKIITFFAFSTENWQRPRGEVQMLMKEFLNFLNNDTKQLCRDNIRLRVIGRDKPLPPSLVSKIRQSERLTAQNTGLTVVLAFNYGGRAEIVDAAAKIAQATREKSFDIKQLSEESFSRFLYAPDLPPPDLLIRTSGELRLSNFLTWQLVYAELYFSQKYWPDFTRQDLVKALKEYQARERRFGRI